MSSILKHCYVDLSLWYELRFTMTCIDMNVILDLSTWIQTDNLGRTKYWPIFAVKLNLHRKFMSARLDVSCPHFYSNPMVVHRKTYILLWLVFTALKIALINAKKPGYTCWMSIVIKANERCLTLVSAISECWHIQFRHVRCVLFGENWSTSL